MLLLPNAGKYKCLLQGKGLQIQINNKTIIIIRVLTVSLFYIGNFGGGGAGGIWSQLDSVFLSFELNYLTPKVGSYIKLKLLKSCIWCKNFKTLSKRKMLKTFRGNLPYFTKLTLFSYFLMYFFCLKSRNSYTKYNFLLASIWYTAQSLALLSSSTQKN